MLSVLTVVVLACALALRSVHSSENVFAELLTMLGIIFLPIVTAVSVLGTILSSLGHLVPVVGNWGGIVGTYVDGAYGIPGWFFLILATLLWLAAIAQLLESNTSSNNHRASSTNSDEINVLTDIRGVGPHVATTLEEAGFDSVADLESGSVDELTDIDGIGNVLAHQIKSQVGDVVDSRGDTDDVQSEPLTSIDSLDEEWADPLNKAGYGSVVALREASTTELADVVGNTLAKRIKSDVGTVRTYDEATLDTTDRTSTSETEQDTTDDSSTTAVPSIAEHDEEELEPLLEIDGIDRSESEALYRAGYTSLEEITTASFSNLTEAIGHESAVRLRSNVGYLPSSSESVPSDSRTSTKDKAETRQNTLEENDQPSDTIDDLDGTDSERTAEEELKALQQAAQSQLDDAMSNPFDDLSATKDQLVRTHVEYASLGTQADQRGDGDCIESTREKLRAIETRLEALPPIEDSLDAARTRVQTTDRSLESVSNTSLERAREHYRTAIDAAEDIGFETVELEREHESIVTELERRNRAALITAVEDVAAELDAVPTVEQVVARRDVNEASYRETFGNWEATLEVCDIDCKGAFADDLRRVAEESNGPLDEATYRRTGRYAPSWIKSFFGSWLDALEHVFDEDELTIDSNGEPIVRIASTTEDYVAAIQRVAESSDRVVKSTDVREQSRFSVNEIVQAFGSWQDALDAANVDNESRLLRELRRVADEVGHPPSTTEMNRHGHVSATLYADYFGTYTEARDRAFATDEGATPEDVDEDITPDDDGEDWGSTEGTSDGKDNDTEQSFTTIAGITEDRRLERPIAVAVLDQSIDPRAKRQARLLVEDLDGTQCWLDVWRKHDVDAVWETGHWYVLEQARGKCWTNRRGESNRQLSTTKDLQITHVGTDRPTGEIDDAIVPETESETDGEDTETDRPADDTDGSGDGTDESGDILDELMGEFEDISGLE